MGLPNKSFAQLVQDMVAAWSAQLGFTATLASGDPYLALMQSVCAQAVFLQAQVQAVNAVARAQTSSGADLDTFYAQFGFLRHGGVAASGPVVFSKFTPAASQVLIPPGVTVQTVGGAIQYVTVADPAQPTWSATLNAYVLAVGQSSLTATVAAVAQGTSSNVTAGQLSQIATALAGIDAVTNTVPIQNGQDAESDAAYRNRFVLYLNSLSKATYGAIVSAVEGVPGVSNFSLQENVDVGGNPRPGEFVVTVDNGTGSPPQSLIDATFAAVDAVRGFTIMAEVIAVVDVLATIVMAVRVASGFDTTTVESNVAEALAEYVNALDIGAPLYISGLEGAALAVAGVLSVQPAHTTINGVQADLVPAGNHAARTNINIIAVGSY